jgi:MFS family permease
MAIGAGAYFVVIVGLKPIAEEFGGLRWVPSLAYSGAIFGMGLGGIFVGHGYTRFGVAVPALAGSLMIVTGAFVAASTTSQWVFLGAHAVLIGLAGNAALFSPLLAHTTRWFDRRRGLAVAIVASSQGLAGIVWPPVYRYVLESGSWRDAYRGYAWLALLTLLPLSMLLWPRSPRPLEFSFTTRHESARSVLGLSAGHATILLSAAIVCCCVAMAMPIVHVVAHVTDLGHPLSRAAEMLSVLLGSAFVGRIAWGVFADRIGGLRVLMTSSACQAASLAMYFFVENLSGLYVISACFGIAFGGIIPCYTLIISRYFPPASVGWRVATVYLFGAIGMALGGWLGGFIFDVSGSYRSAFAIGLVFNLANLAIVASLLAREMPRLRPADA